MLKTEPLGHHKETLIYYTNPHFAILSLWQLLLCYPSITLSLREFFYKMFSSIVQLCRLFATPRTAARQVFLSITNCQSMLKTMSIELVVPSNHLTRCCSLPFLFSIFLSIKVFSKESVLRIRWPKCWSFHFSISPSSEYSGLISFGIDWFDLLAVQGTLKSLPKHHSLKALILQCSVS